MAIELASSVAGVIGLAGLTLQSASALYTFCHAIPRVAGELEAIIEEIQKLQNLLKVTRTILDDCAGKGNILSSSPSSLETQLQQEVTACEGRLRAWSCELATLQTKNGQWVANVTKKLKLAADRGRFMDLRSKLSSHREQNGLFLGLLSA